MKNIIITLLAFAVTIACAAYISVPDQRLLLSETCNSSGLGPASTFVFNEYTTRYKNYVVYSTLRDLDGKILAIGAFGNVYLQK